MSKLKFWKDLFWFKLMSFASQRISKEGKMAIMAIMERDRACSEHRSIH
jgi:hypothetical protein